MKVGRDLYKVIHDNQSIVLFGNEMVPYLPSTYKNSESIQSANALPPLDQHLVLDKIGVYADLQRNFLIAVRCTECKEHYPLRDISEHMASHRTMPQLTGLQLQQE